MTTRRRPSEAVISVDITITQINRLPVATLKLQLDQFHLPHGGNKKAIVRRLYDHLQEQHPRETEGSASSSSESDSSGGEDDAGSGTAEGDDAGSSKSASTRDPFTKSQQKALERTVKSLLRDSDHTKGRHALSLSHNSGRKSHHHRESAEYSQVHKRSHFSPVPPSKRSRHSPSTSSTSAESSTSSSPSRPSSSSDSMDHSHGRHHKGHRSRYRHHTHSHRHHKHHDHRGHHETPATTFPVPRKLRHSIGRGEFVVLADLLSECLVLSGGCTKYSSQRKAARTRPITGLDTWLEAWSIYAGVLVSYKPELAPDLFRYQNFITRQSRRFKPYAWLQYDAQFRLKLASNPSIKWSDTDTELIATWLSADAAREKPACFACGNPEHLASDCPWKGSGTSNSSVLNCPVCNASGHAARDCPKLGQPAPPPADTRHTGEEFCHIYNRRGNCFRGSRCSYLHACSNCKGSHPKRACPRQPR